MYNSLKEVLGMHLTGISNKPIVLLQCSTKVNIHLSKIGTYNDTMGTTIIATTLISWRGHIISSGGYSPKRVVGLISSLLLVRALKLRSKGETHYTVGHIHFLNQLIYIAIQQIELPRRNY